MLVLEKVHGEDYAESCQYGVLKHAKTVFREFSQSMECNERLGNITLSFDFSNGKDEYLKIANDILDLESINWGRIITFIIFSIKVAEGYRLQQEIELATNVANWLPNTLIPLNDWMDEQGRLDGLLTRIAKPVKRSEPCSWLACSFLSFFIFYFLYFN